MKCNYKIKNIDCVNCAKKIEDYLNKDANISNASINFNTLNISYVTNIENSINYVNKKIKEIEPDTYIYDKEIKEKNYFYDYLNLILGFILAAIGIFIEIPYYINYILIIIGFILLLKRSATLAFKLMVKSHQIDENFLIVISSIGAFLINEKFEGLMVITLYEFGKILESKAINKTRKSVSALAKIKEDYANLKVNNAYKKVLSESVKVGDTIIIKKGERIPLDGIITSGITYIDNSSLTGESKLLSLTIGDKVLSGSINKGDIIEVKVDTPYSDSTVNKILNLVENASENKAKTETFVTKYAKYYTVIVLILAVLVGIFLPLITNCTYSDSIYKAFTFLVISCPCAIAISVPLSYFSSLGFASSKGILIKGSNYLDGIKDIDTIVFDKTGTLTKGTFHIAKINILDNKYKEEDILRLFKIGETYSNHPIAVSLVKEIDIDVSDCKIKDYQEVSGLGIEYKLDKQTIKIGNAKHVNSKEKEDNTVIYISVNENIIGSIVIEDTLKSEAPEVITKLNNMGINTKMFTGDNFEVAKDISSKLGIKDYKHNMLPDDKYNELTKILKKKNNNKLVAFVGDGINDSPVIALSDIGFSMGGVGNDSAIEASDIVITNDNLKSLLTAIKISKKTNTIIKENVTFAILTKITILILSVIGIASMWQAVFADVGVTIITIFNTLRLLKGRYYEKNK